MRTTQPGNIEQEFMAVLLGQGVRVQEWQPVVDYALEKKLFPQFFHQLQKRTDIPQEVFTRCKGLYLANLKTNLVQERELVRLLVLLKEADVPVIVLKGLVFAKVIYGDLALRQVATDFDLMVHLKDFSRTKEIIKGAGYVCQDEIEGHARGALELKNSGQLKFWRKSEHGGTFFLELHQQPRALFAYSESVDLWEDAKELDVQGVRFLGPSIENMFIYLCLLAMSTSEFTELRYLYDIHCFLERFKAEVNWEKMGRKLQHSRHAACIYFSLKLMRDLFGTAVPEDFLVAMKPGAFKRVILSIWLNKGTILFASRERRKRHYYFVDHTWLFLATSYLYSRDIRDCLKISFRKIFPPREEMSITYGSSGHPFILYAKRLLRPFLRIFRAP